MFLEFQVVKSLRLEIDTYLVVCLSIFIKNIYHLEKAPFLCKNLASQKTASNQKI